MMMQFEQEGKISLDDYLLKYPLNTGWHSPHRINPNIRLKHVLSIRPGEFQGGTYSYHGGRYNFLSGVFDQISGRESPASYVEEVKAKILQPLHMDSTRAGYPDKPDPLIPRIVKRYQVGPGKDGIVYTNAPYDWNAGYPASGLLSTINDLATYASALDDNRLIPRERYEKITTPFVNDRGQSMPYGYGWVTQRFEGIRLHWAYGHDDADAYLFLRVPDRKLTLILFSNCGAPHKPAGWGTVMFSGRPSRSPFSSTLSCKAHRIGLQLTITVILRRSVRLSPDQRGRKIPPIIYEELTTQALIRAFMRDTFHTQSKQPEQLARLLYDVYPQAFTSPDPTLIYLMSLLDSANLRAAAYRLIRSYNPSSDFRPDIPYWIGKYYEKQGDGEKAMKYYQALVDTSGFEDENSTIEACSLLAKYYLKHGNMAKGREYLWKAALYGQEAQYSAKFFTDRLADLNRSQ